MLKMNRLTKYGLLTAMAVSLAAGAGISLWPEKVRAACRSDAGIGNGSTTGDPGLSGFHNKAWNAPAQPGSAAAKADPLHEIDDPNEPN